MPTVYEIQTKRKFDIYKCNTYEIGLDPWNFKLKAIFFLFYGEDQLCDIDRRLVLSSIKNIPNEYHHKS